MPDIFNDPLLSPAFVISPWVRRGLVDSTFYSTTSVIRTMELLLGLPPMSQYDAIAEPIVKIWGTAPRNEAP